MYYTVVVDSCGKVFAARLDLFLLSRDTVTSSHGVRVAADRGSEIALQLLPFNLQTKTPVLNNNKNK